jgi:type VI protein secretion system component Hcp
MGAELIVCRPAGVDIPNGEKKGAKVPFLKFVFDKIQLTKCSLAISKEQPPSEDIEFWFDKVTMETIWTDNETGEKLPGVKNTISFDFGMKDGQPEFKEFQD